MERDDVAKQKKLPPSLQAWVGARQEPWKLPLPLYLEELYLKRFKKERPDNVRSVEQMVKAKKRKQDERKQRRRQQQDQPQPENAGRPAAQPHPEKASDDDIPF